MGQVYFPSLWDGLQGWSGSRNCITELGPIETTGICPVRLALRNVRIVPIITMYSSVRLYTCNVLIQLQSKIVYVGSLLIP